MVFSILIKNGIVVDGSGKEPFRADVGLSAGRIQEVGNLSGASAEIAIDAANLYVTPGFIDLTSHSDVYGSLFFSPLEESLLKQGVTTILVGNCGESLAPVARKESLNNLERWTSGFSVPVNWNGVKEYYENIARLGTGPNVATLVGEETLHRNADTAPERLFLLEKAMREGAWGLSGNLSFAARSKEEDEEILGLLKIVKKHNGLYKIHLRDEGKDFLPSVSAAVNLARASGARTAISHLKAVGRGAWGDFNAALKMIREAQQEGIDISFDAFPYLRTGSYLAAFLPEWAKAGATETILKRLEGGEARARIISELKNFTLHPDRIFIASAAKDKSIVGQTLESVAARAGAPPEETILDILKINELGVSIFGKTISGKNLLEAAREPDGIIASDGAGYNLDFKRFGDLAHPRSFGAFPRFFRLIAPKAGLSPGAAIAKMTSLPAKALGLKDRGLIKPKHVADIAIFRPEEFRDVSTYKNPYRYAEGLRFLCVSGNLAVAEGEIAAERYGEILRKKG